MFSQIKNTLKSPTQKEPRPGMEPNNAGGYGYRTTDLQQLMRFLILGTTGGTFYLSEKDLLKQNLEAVKAAVTNNPKEALDMVLEVSHQGIAANNDAAIYVLALLLSLKETKTVHTKAGDTRTVVESSEVAREAMDNVGKVCRTFTHMSHLVTFLRKGKLRGWGRGFRRAMSRAWFQNKSIDSIIHSLVKYQSRDGVSQNDLARLLHPMSVTPTQDPMRKQIYDHVFYRGDRAVTPEHPRLVAAYKLLKSTDPDEALSLMREHDLPMETVPTNLRTKEVYSTAIETNGPEWLVRNMGNLSRIGLTEPFMDLNPIISRLLNKDLLKKARLHPLTILKACHQYRQGGGHLSSNTWTVNPKIAAALMVAFYDSFEYLEPSGKNILIAVDVSGSMRGAQTSGIPGMTVHEAAAVLAMVAARTEPNYHIIAFDTAGGSYRGYGSSKPLKMPTGVYPVEALPNTTLDSLIKEFSSHGGGGTDCSLPFTYAIENKLPVDLVVSLTDSETWSGRSHVMDSLQALRNKSGRPVKAVNICMAANRTTTLDGNDPGVLEVVGFDTRIPQIISAFASM